MVIGHRWICCKHTNVYIWVRLQSLQHQTVMLLQMGAGRKQACMQKCARNLGDNLYLHQCETDTIDFCCIQPAAWWQIKPAGRDCTLDFSFSLLWKTKCLFIARLHKRSLASISSTRSHRQSFTPSKEFQFGVCG